MRRGRGDRPRREQVSHVVVLRDLLPADEAGKRQLPWRLRGRVWWVAALRASVQGGGRGVPWGPMRERISESGVESERTA